MTLFMGDGFADNIHRLLGFSIRIGFRGKRPFFTRILLIIGTLGVCGCQTDDRSVEKDATQIRECLNRYAEAVSSRNGKIAYECVTVQSLMHYRKMLFYTLRGTFARRNEDANEYYRLMLLTSRYLFSREELLQMSTKEYFIQWITHGEKDRVLAACKIVSIDVEGKKANVVVSFKEEKKDHDPAHVQLTFRKEMGQWKFDCTWLVPYANEELASVKNAFLAQYPGLELEDYYNAVLKKGYGGVARNDIWKPIVD